MLPNFLFIGTSKSGTTSLYQYLKQHPEVFMPEDKEPHFLLYAGSLKQPFQGQRYSDYKITVKNKTAYEALFDECRDFEKAAGEASIGYLAYPEQVIPAIKEYVPEIRLIAILRQPADRAFSAFLHARRGGWDLEHDFSRVCNSAFQFQSFWQIPKNSGIHNPEFYFRHGFYFCHLSAYFSAIPKHRIKIVLYDDLKSDPFAVLRDIFSFLEVDETFRPDISQRHNQGAIPRIKTIHSALRATRLAPKWLRWGLGIRKRLLALNLQPPTRFEPDLRQRLTEYYREDILQLQDLIGRDLSHWLETDHGVTSQ